MPVPIRSQVVRFDVANAYYFITVVTYQRRAYFGNPKAIAILRDTLHTVSNHHPFGLRGYVFLTDHLHLLLKLYEGTSIINLMHSFKRNSTLNIKKQSGHKERMTLWQRSFYDHVIRDQQDFNNHLNYIHYNPVKHGLVSQPEAYPHSSFHTYVKRGWYEIGWGYTELPYSEPNENPTWGE